MLMELGSAAQLHWARRLPAFPTRLRSEPGLYIVVVGESSARGDPYQPWVSIGQIVAWQLERVFPGRPIEVDIRAEGGLVLEQALLPLVKLARRPDAIIVFAGHNEFQTRFGWSRNVAHYVEEGPRHPLVLAEFARSISSTCTLIFNSLDRYHGQVRPLPKITRATVDHPICTPSEHEFLRNDFQIRLEALAGYCSQIGCLPIFIVPGSNDGSFEPNRSVLAGSTSVETRAAFERRFRAIRDGEDRDPAVAIRAYRALIDEHPEFAESHYRLGRLLARAGEWDGAGRHFTLARDLDGFPLRCPSDFQDAIRSAARDQHAIMVDAPSVLARVSPHGILDEHLYHDAHHTSLVGLVALANDLLDQLAKRKAFGWPESIPAPRVEPSECALRFGLDSNKWAEVCERSFDFYVRTAYVRYDPSGRERAGDLYHRAAIELRSGQIPSETELRALAISPALVKPAPALTSNPAASL
jgi:hypothetical protein